MYQGLIKVGTNNDTIYDGRDERYVQLCYSHSVELFKTGQQKFMRKYKDNFNDIVFDEAIFSSRSRQRQKSIWY
jgi:hypothetical protein